MAGGRGQRRAACRRVPSRIHRRVRYALQIVIHGYAPFFVRNPSDREREIVNLWHPPRAMHSHLGLEPALLALSQSMHDYAVARFVDATHLGGEFDPHAQRARPLDELVHQSRLKTLQRTGITMQDDHLRPGPRGYMREFKRNVSPANTNKVCG